MATKYDRRYLEKLAKKVINGRATNSEKLFLDEYYNAFNKEPDISSTTTQSDLSNLKNEINDSLHQYIDGQSKLAIPVYRLRSVRIAAAASIILALSVGSYFLLHKQQSQQIAYNKNDILPGRNQAVLTIDNGEKIILTSAKNGQLALQGSIAIKKTADGQVVYNTDQSITAENKVIYNTMATPRGGQYHLTLADGTNVWLDAASSITYPVAFTGSARKVAITGQVYFEVVHNAAKPFKVTVKGQTIEDLGTHFNINAYDDEAALKTTLLEGSVKVYENGQTAILKPGQQSLTEAGSTSIKVKNIDVEEVTAWKDGYFDLNKANLESIMRQVSRWYDVDVIYSDESLKTRVFGGTVSRFKNLSQLLEKLELTGAAHFKIENQKIFVSK